MAAFGSNIPDDFQIRFKSSSNPSFEEFFRLSEPQTMIKIFSLKVLLTSKLYLAPLLMILILGLLGDFDEFFTRMSTDVEGVIDGMRAQSSLDLSGSS